MSNSDSGRSSDLGFLIILGIVFFVFTLPAQIIGWVFGIEQFWAHEWGWLVSFIFWAFVAIGVYVIQAANTMHKNDS